MLKTTYRPSPTALLNPRLDSNFKALFTDNSDSARKALKSFLESILEAKVSNIQLRPNELAEESIHDKQARFDITCTLNHKEAVNIEIQGMDINSCYAKRAEYYVAHLLNHYTPRGIDWQDVPKVFQISILNFIYDETSPQSLTVYQMQSSDNRHLSDRMSIIFVELPKMQGNDREEDIGKLTGAQKWGKFLLYADKEEKQAYIKKLCRSMEGIMEANVTLAKISQDEANWLRQTSQDMLERDIRSGFRQERERGAALQKAKDDEIIQQITEEKNKAIEEIARLKALLAEKG